MIALAIVVKFLVEMCQFTRIPITQLNVSFILLNFSQRFGLDELPFAVREADDVGTMEEPPDSLRYHTELKSKGLRGTVTRVPK